MTAIKASRTYIGKKHFLAGKKQSKEHIAKRMSHPNTIASLHTRGFVPLNKIVFTAEMDASLLDFYVRRKLSIMSTCKNMGLSQVTVTRRLRELDVKLRSRSEAKKGKTLSSEHVANVVKATKGKKKKPYSLDRRRAMSITTIECLSRIHPYKQGVHFSPKLNRQIFYRSSYEKKYMEGLDADPHVSWYEYEPKSVCITYQFGDMVRRYIPDFLIYFVNGDKKLVEIKSSYGIKFEKTQAKIAALRLYRSKHPEINGCQVVVGAGNQMSRIVNVIEL